MNGFPDTIAIAGAWGYIGRKVLDAALRRGVRAYVHDPGPVPDDLDPGTFTRVANAGEFYGLTVDLFHLALHPHTRRQALEALLRRGMTEPLLILNEKPMVSPDQPEQAPGLIAAVGRGRATMLFNFPELFDPLTQRVVQVLSSFNRVALTSVVAERSKDREDPAIPRNSKPMLPIQYQESVHCLAFVLHVLAVLRGSFDAGLSEGVSVSAQSEPYCPPNPEAYPRIVDGRCEYRLSLGSLTVHGLTDFTRGARWRKRRVLRGVGDGRPFVIEADYVEGKKGLKIDGTDQHWDPRASSYEAILSTIARWRASLPAEVLRTGPYPNVHLAWRAFQLSSLLWASSQRRTAIQLADLSALDAFEAGFPTPPVPAGPD